MAAPLAYGLEVQPDGRKKFVYAASFAHYLEQIAELFARFGGTPQVECIAHADTGMYKAHVYQNGSGSRKDLPINYYAYNVRLRNHREIIGPIYIFQRSHEPLPVELVEGSAQRMFQMVADDAAASGLARSVDILPNLRVPERVPTGHERLVEEELRRMRDPELRQKEQEWRDAASAESPSAAAARPSSVRPASDDSVWFRRDLDFDSTAPQVAQDWAPHAPTFPGIPPFTPGKPRSPSEFKLPPPKNVCTAPANHSSDYTPFGGQMGAPPQQQYNGVDAGFARADVRSFTGRNEPWATM